MNIKSLTALVLLCILFNTAKAQTDPLYIDKDGNIYMRVKGPNKKLTVEGYADFSDSIITSALRLRKQLSVSGPATFSDSVRMLRQLSIGGNTTVGGNTSLNGSVTIGSAAQRSNLDISGDVKVKGGLTLGTNEQRSNLDVSGQLKIAGGVPGEGKTLTSDANGLASWQKGARRDFRPYGNPSFYWDALKDCSGVKDRLEQKGSAKSSDNYCSQKWGNRIMVTLEGLTQETTNKSTPPENGIYMSLPATAKVHNNLLISTIDSDRWSVWSVWLCDQNKNPVVKLAISSNNASRCVPASTHTLGPFNTPKETSAHTWMSFPINATDVEKYMYSGTLKFLVTSGPQNTDLTTLYMSGLALVPNPNGFMQQPSVTFHWGLNGETYNAVIWGENSNNESYAAVPPNAAATVFIKVIDPSKDLLVTFQEINHNWYGGALNITVGSDPTAFRLSTGIIGMASTLYSAYLGMRPQSIIIPADIVKKQLMNVSPKGVQNVIMLKLQNNGDYNYHFHGIDTEIY